VYRYLVQGLWLRTDLPLSGIEESDTAKPDVLVRFHEFPVEAERFAREHLPYYCDPPTFENALRAWQVPDGFYLRYGESLEFVINRTGTEICARANDSTPFDDLCAYLTGVIVGFTLRVRGTLCLHASAIQVGDAVFAIMGPCGAGKSTLAASFHHAGFRVLSDDVLEVEAAPLGFQVRPSLSWFKLWPDSARAIYGDENLFPRLVESEEKRIVEQGRVPETDGGGILKVIYLLGERTHAGAHPVIENTASAESMISVASHTYANYLLTPEMRKREFEALQKLMTCVTLRRVTPTSDLSALADVRAALLADFHHTLASTAALS
jgi:hypothetical protein